MEKYLAPETAARMAAAAPRSAVRSMSRNGTFWPMILSFPGRGGSGRTCLSPSGAGWRSDRSPTRSASSRTG